MAKNRPMLNMITADLCDRIAAGDVAAAREGVLRLSHGVREYNARKLRAVLSDVVILDAAPEPSPAPVPVTPVAPAPVVPVVPSATPDLVAQVTAAVLAALSPAPVAEVVAVSTPDPAPAPVEPDFQAHAASQFSKRVGALASEGNKRFLATRANKLAKSQGWTPEDVSGLSDQECLDLVIATIR